MTPWFQFLYWHLVNAKSTAFSPMHKIWEIRTFDISKVSLTIKLRNLGKGTMNTEHPLELNGVVQNTLSYLLFASYVCMQNFEPWYLS